MLLHNFHMLQNQEGNNDTKTNGYSQRLRQKCSVTFWFYQGFYYFRKFTELNPDMLEDNITFPLSDTEKAARWRNDHMPDF